MKLLQGNASRDAGSAANPAPNNGSKGLGGDTAQQNAVARIGKLLLEGAWSDSGFLVVMPANARIVEGGSGNDVVTIASGGNGPGLNYVSLGDGNDLLNLVSAGDATSDYWQGGASAIASAVSDSVDAKVGVMVPEGQGIFAGAGNDIVNIAAGRDVYAVSGNGGHDLLNVAAGRNVSGIWGGDGNDVIAVAGGMNVDNVTGDAGDDIVTVAAGRDARDIAGGEGRDVLTVAAGQTVSDVYGGRGSDIVTVAAGHAAYYIWGGEGDDAISVAAAKVGHVEGGDGNDTIAINARTAEAISGGRGNDTLDLTGTVKASVVFDRGDGQDHVRVGAETTIVFAGRSLDDAAVSYGDGTITIAFSDNGDSVTLDYSASALKGAAPALSFAKAGHSEVLEAAPESRDYAAYHSANGFSLTLR